MTLKIDRLSVSHRAHKKQVLKLTRLDLLLDVIQNVRERLLAHVSVTRKETDRVRHWLEICTQIEHQLQLAEDSFWWPRRVESIVTSNRWKVLLELEQGHLECLSWQPGMATAVGTNKQVLVYWADDLWLDERLWTAGQTTGAGVL